MDDLDLHELALFKLDEDLFGISIDSIQEINKNLIFTQVYNAGSDVKGVMNLRGQIVTVIDLREKLKYERKEMDLNNRVIVVRFNGESVGLLVDRVEDIITVDSDKLETSKATISGVNENYFSGVYKEEEDLVVILDVNQLLNDEEPSKVVAAQ